MPKTFAILWLRCFVSIFFPYVRAVDILGIFVATVQLKKRKKTSLEAWDGGDNPRSIYTSIPGYIWYAV